MPTHSRPRGALTLARLAAVLALAAVLGVTGLLGGCNTTAGAGRDLSAAGHAVTNAADRTRQRL